MNKLMLNWPSQIVLVRHGESEGNKLGAHRYHVLKKPTHRYALTELGVEQAQAAGRCIERKFGADSFDAYFTSTYDRAQETFRHMFEGRMKGGRQIVPIIDSRLNEIYRGLVSVMSPEEVDKDLAIERRTFALNGWFHNVPLGGQSCVMIEHIIYQFLAFLRESCAGKKVIIVGHGTWINLCCRILLNRTPEECLKFHETVYFKNAGITVFEKDEEGDLVQTMESFTDWDVE